MLRCIDEAAKLSGIALELTLKRHPVCRIEKSDCWGLTFEITDQPLGEIMNAFDFAFSSNSTSAGLDALLAGLPVVIFLDADDFNQSPLRGVPGIRFVDSPQALAGCTAFALE
jgi:surface carbohydrate biosynthesis protein (TIGR04326 family)